ncbi:ORF6N domain-containing protein [Fructilactobacillus vespulae]|uniref:ORF6N domain-containing protein n=1 Tax=Fructilactobacillus vespulae TaxID=1249630 RepID=UPI0039B556E8
MALKVIGKEKVGKYEFTGIEGGFGKNKKAMLVKDIAKIHGTTIKRVNELINRNKKRFSNNDLTDLKSSKYSEVVRNDLGFTQNSINRASHIYLLSERGYAKLLKILDDDTAWEVYDKLVDEYFNMRVAVKSNNTKLIDKDKLALMKQNAATRQANALYRIAMKVKNNDVEQQRLLNEAQKCITEMNVLPVMTEKDYSAQEIGKKLGVSSNKVGRMCNELGLKAEKGQQNKYGRWANSKSKSSHKEVPQWLYTEAGFKAIKEHLND